MKRTPFNNLQTAKYILVLILLCSVVGCSLFRASPLKASPFIPIRDGIDMKAEKGPFQGILFVQQQKFIDLNNKRKAWYVAPVDYTSLEAMITESTSNESRRSEKIAEVMEIARYTKVLFEKALTERKENPFRITKAASSTALTLQLALVEVEPTSPIINTFGTIAGIFVPGGSLISVFGSGSIAIEGIVRDGKTGAVLVEFKDRTRDKTTPFTIKDFQRYAHLRNAIDEWSNLFSEFAATNGTKDLSPVSPFSINPL